MALLFLPSQLTALWHLPESTQKLYTAARPLWQLTSHHGLWDVACNISISLQGAGLRWANHLTQATKSPPEHYDNSPEPVPHKWPGVLSHGSDGKLSETDNWAFWCFISPFIRFYHCRLFEDVVLLRYYFWTAFLLLEYTQATVLCIRLLATLTTGDWALQQIYASHYRYVLSTSTGVTSFKFSRRNQQLFTQK